jgi:transposase
VIDVAILSSIRRWHFRDQVPIREIARRTGLSRNTVKKYLNNKIIEPKYEKRETVSSLDAYSAKLSAWLATEAKKGRKHKRCIKQLHRDLVQLGFSGSYDTVSRFSRRWRKAQREQNKTAGRGSYIPLIFAAGEAFQFDWSEDWAVIAGERTKLQIAHFKLCHSRAFVLRAYPLQTQEMLFDAHNHAFTIFGGVPARGIYDNMKTAVNKILTGKQRDINVRFSAMTSHYLFEAEFCSPAAGWEKGQVEKNVQDARHRIWQQIPAFSSLEALNNWLQERCLALWQEISHPEQTERSIADVYTDERSCLMASPMPFDGYVEYTKRVSPTCLITFERNRYSVPGTYANQPISLRVYADRLVFVAQAQIIAEHPRVISRSPKVGRTIYDWRHYLCVLQRKPGALRNGAPFTEFPAAFKQLQTILLRHPGGDREMVEILALVLQEDEEAVLTAVELAIESGVPSKQHVLNILKRLIEPERPEPLEMSGKLMLTIEPQANMSRYDQLRGGQHAI